MCASRPWAAAVLAPQRAAYRAVFFFQTRISRWVRGTKSGRSTPKNFESQCSDGVLSPVPRMSQPTTSYWLPTPPGMLSGRKSARPVPEAPGPPGLASRIPFDVPVARCTRTASVIFWPSGFAQSSGTTKSAHWSVPQDLKVITGVYDETAGAVDDALAPSQPADDNPSTAATSTAARRTTISSPGARQVRPPDHPDVPVDRCPPKRRYRTPAAPRNPVSRRAGRW